MAPEQALEEKLAADCATWFSCQGILPLALRWIPADGKAKNFGKTPIGSGWSEYTQDQALTFFKAAAARQPSVNIGIMTGKRSNLIGVDIDLLKDDDPPGTIDGLVYYNAHIKPRLEIEGCAPIVVQTGSGGLHLWFNWSPKAARLKTRATIKSGTNVVKIDVRNDGGYLVAPPSRHYSGNYYQFLTTFEGPLPARPEMPEWFIDLLDPPARPIEPTVAEDSPKVAPKVDKVAALVALLNPTRADTYNDWAEIIWAITRACDWAEGYRDLAHWFSHLSSKYDAEEVNKKIAETKRHATGFGLKHLIELAKQDNPEGFKAWQDKYKTKSAKTAEEDPEKLSPREAAEILIQAFNGRDNFLWLGGDNWRCWSEDQLLWCDTAKREVLANMSGFFQDELTNQGFSKDRIVKYSDPAYIDNKLLGFITQQVALPEWPTPPDWQAPVMGGRMLCLRTGATRERTQEDYCTFECPFDPTVATEQGMQRVDKFFQDISYGHSSDFKLWLINHCLYCLSGELDTKRPGIINFRGRTLNGKSTLTTTIEKLLGDYGGSFNPAILFDKEGAERTHQAHLLTLKDKRCVVFSEIGSAKANVQMLKRITGKDTLSARGVNEKKFVNFVSYAKILIAANSILNVPFDAALIHRIKVVEINAQFVDNPIEDYQFKATDIREWFLTPQGRACFVMYLISNYREGILPIPETVMETAREVGETSKGPHEVFADECLMADPNGTGKGDSIWRRWQRWAREHDQPVGDKTNFIRWLKDKYLPRRDPVAGRCYSCREIMVEAPPVLT